MHNQVIRPMQVTDLDVVLTNERRSYSHPWSQGIFENCLANDSSCWVLEVQESVIGHGILSVGADEAHLLNVCVLPEYRGKGYGRDLVEYLIAQARKKAATIMFLEVRASNQTAYLLYEKLGFNEIGLRPDYYPAYSGGEDALVLAIELI